jgi:hypothetical protein
MSMRSAAPAGLPVLLALVLTACPGPPPDEAAPTPEDTPTPEPTEATPTPPEDDVALAQQCANPDGFSVEYPDGWVTNEAEENELPPCSLFDPASVDTGEGGDVPADIAVFMRVEPVAFAAVDDPTVEEVAREELSLAGREAVRVETEATGEGLFPEGLRSTSYRVDLGEQTFMATARDVGEPGYASKQDALDAMIETVRFDG